MSRSTNAMPRSARQRGDILTESLIAILLFAVAGVGISQVTSKVAVAQRDSKVQQQVVNELRSRLLNRPDQTALCDGNAVTTSNFAAQVTVAGCELTTAEVGGFLIENVSRPVVLSADLNGNEVRVGGMVSQ